MDHLWANITASLWALSGISLVSLILFQRGRGGGLAGAFGAGGSQSAFGTRAGDIFTRITIGTAAAWIALAAISGVVMRSEIVGRLGN